MSSKSSQNDRPAYTEPPAPHPRNPASVAPWLKNPYSELPRPLPPRGEYTRVKYTANVPTTFSRKEQEERKAQKARLQEVGIYSPYPQPHLQSLKFKARVEKAARDAAKSVDPTFEEYNRFVTMKMLQSSSKKKPRSQSTQGGKAKIYTGPRNGKYIIKNGSKVYIDSKS